MVAQMVAWFFAFAVEALDVEGVDDHRACTASLWRMTFGLAPGSNGTPASRDAAWSASGRRPN
jgi:hypothetical protein